MQMHDFVMNTSIGPGALATELSEIHDRINLHGFVSMIVILLCKLLGVPGEICSCKNF